MLTVQALQLIMLLLLHVLHLEVLGRLRQGGSHLLRLENVPKHQPPLVQESLRCVHGHGELGQIVFFHHLCDCCSRRGRRVGHQTHHMRRCFRRQLAGNMRKLCLGSECLGCKRHGVFHQEIVNVGIQQLAWCRRASIAHTARGVWHRGTCGYGVFCHVGQVELARGLRS